MTLFDRHLRVQRFVRARLGIGQLEDWSRRCTWCGIPIDRETVRVGRGFCTDECFCAYHAMVAAEPEGEAQP